MALLRAATAARIMGRIQLGLYENGLTRYIPYTPKVAMSLWNLRLITGFWMDLGVPYLHTYFFCLLLSGDLSPCVRDNATFYGNTILKASNPVMEGTKHEYVQRHCGPFVAFTAVLSTVTNMESLRAFRMKVGKHIKKEPNQRIILNSSGVLTYTKPITPSGNMALSMIVGINLSMTCEPLYSARNVTPSWKHRNRSNFMWRFLEQVRL